jgi:hypothetical protein
MSGGLAVKTKKRGVVRAGAERLPGPRFLALTAWGPQAPLLIKQTMGVWRERSEAVRQTRDRLKGHPQEREHSDAVGGTRDRVLPARGPLFLARWDRHPKGRDPASHLRDLRGSASVASRARPALAGRAKI